jgi:hypothetical protein
MRNRKRPNVEVEDQGESKRGRVLDDDEPEVADPVSSLLKPHITGIKKQSRYDPGVPMTRDQLKSWRKEARRVRNRESAAASRTKNRELVSELETEVNGLKAKYAAALKMIIDLEASRAMSDCASFTPPALLRQDLTDLQRSSRPSSPNAAHVQTVSPPQSPPVSPSLVAQELLFGISPQESLSSFPRDSHFVAHPLRHDRNLKSQHQHLTMISRPFACV